MTRAISKHIIALINGYKDPTVEPFVDEYGDSPESIEDEYASLIKRYEASQNANDALLRSIDACDICGTYTSHDELDGPDAIEELAPGLTAIIAENQDLHRVESICEECIGDLYVALDDVSGEYEDHSLPDAFRESLEQLAAEADPWDEGWTPSNDDDPFTDRNREDPDPYENLRTS